MHQSDGLWPDVLRIARRHEPRRVNESTRRDSELPYDSSEAYGLYQTDTGDWLEIMNQPQVREAWGIADGESSSEFSKRTYAAKFDFHSGGPGYVGDLYVLQGDALTDHGPMLLRRIQTDRCS